MAGEEEDKKKQEAENPAKDEGEKQDEKDAKKAEKVEDAETENQQKSEKDEEKEVMIAKEQNRGGLPQGGLNTRLCLAIFAGAFGSGFQHGYHTGVVNAPQKLISDWIQVCPEGVNGTEGFDSECAYTQNEVTMIWSWVVAIFCIGGLLGGCSIGLLSAKFGRKGTLLLNNVLVLLACVAMFAAKYANTYILLLVGRFLIGINSGINAGVSPMYLSEIAPVNLRGALGTVYQLIITISILLSQIFGMTGILGNDVGWPFLLTLCLIPGIIQVVLLPLCPESPMHLLSDKEDEERATAALVWLRMRIDVHDEMDEMKKEVQASKQMTKVTLLEMVRNSALRAPMLIAMMMMLAQQLSGINAVMFFSTNIFLNANLNTYQAQVATLIMGTINVLMTFVSLVLIEKAGRVTLMIVGLSIMFVTTTLLMICLLAVNTVTWLSFVSVVMVIGFVIGFATGPGSIPWFFVTELFATSARPIASSIAVVTNWSANFLVGLAFLPIKEAIGPYVFVIFMVIQLLFVLYMKLVVPETKGKTIDEITSKFK